MTAWSISAVSMKVFEFPNLNRNSVFWGGEMKLSMDRRLVGYRECPHVIGYRRQGVLVLDRYFFYFLFFRWWRAELTVQYSFSTGLVSTISSLPWCTHARPHRFPSYRCCAGQCNSAPTKTHPKYGQLQAPLTTTTTPKLGKFRKSI